VCSREVPEVPAIERDLNHMMPGEDFAPQVLRHIFVSNRRAWRGQLGRVDEFDQAKAGGEADD